MRHIQTCTFGYALHETTRQGHPIQPPQETGTGAFTAITRNDGGVQSIESPEGHLLHNISNLNEMIQGSRFNLDDEGARVVLLNTKKGPWTITKTLPR